MPSDLSADVERKWLDLSLAQQAVWLDAKLSGGNGYQLGGWARVETRLDEAALKQSVALVMARHDGLRLRVDSELPRQWVDESTQPPFRIFELANDGGDFDKAFDAHVAEVFATEMPLGDHALFQLDLIRAGSHRCYLLWRFHHLIADAASVLIAMIHLMDAYEALTGEASPELAPASSYLGTIASDASYLESAQYQRDQRYWLARFEPMPPPLIADLEERSKPQGQAPTEEWILDGGHFAEFQDAAKAAGTTTQRALFALFAIALARRYGQWDMVSGIALHRRELANRNAIGMMAGVIAVRSAVDPFWSLQECVQAFSEQLDKDLRHQRLPVDVLARSLGLSGTGRAGLFEVAMSYLPNDSGRKAPVVSGVPVVVGAVPTKEASPISLHVNELASADGLEIRIAINPDFLEPAEAVSALALLKEVLGKFVQEPDAQAGELAPLTPGERASVVEEWNRTEAFFERGTLDRLFAAQAWKTPEAIAVVGKDGAELTYSDLDSRSTRLAKQLAARGVGLESVVGVRMERSAETIIALLAILKAGGVYLPLDPAYPAERLDYISKDSGAMLVLQSIDGMDGEAELPTLTDPNRLAYVIYTSGTTGLPKGVSVPHSAPVNLAFARRRCHDPLGVGDRVLAAISVGFDVSIGQLLLPLLSGATVVIAGDLKSMGGTEFWEFLEQRRVTHINSVPSFFDSILDTAPKNGSLSLKRLMLGGETLSGALVGRIRRALPGVSVVNMYGPTEACIDATYWIATEADSGEAVLPIGRPLSNYRAYVLDEGLDPTGVGVTGELYLGGAGLARGYVNSPELTAERLVADPFSATPGARLYRTGDRARWRTDGAIEFLGRVDRQLKIRGFRVEPEEIAGVLLEHSMVSQAVVVPRAHKTGGVVRLVAYVVPRRGGPTPETGDLRAHLAQRLPDYMVPSAFVSIAAIPLSRNGKLDEKALPSPDLNEGEYVAPRTRLEETIAGVFAEVLELQRCGATDNFFELGGHSLLATSVVSRLRGLGILVSLRSIFEMPTVDELARHVESSSLSPGTPERITGLPRPVEIPLSFPQERIWFVDTLQQDTSFNIPVALELRGKLDPTALEQALGRIVERHEALRTRIVLRGNKPSQEIVPASSFRPATVHLTSASQKELIEHLQTFASQRFDLAGGFPFAMRLIALEEERHVLALVIHHVAFDGWSASIFLREFAQLYNALTQKRHDPLPPVALQYADFAIWQREQKREADLTFWLAELADAPPASQLPADSAEETRHAEHPVQTQSVRLDAKLRTALEHLAQQQGASLFMVLHAAFALLLARWSNQDDVVVGTVVANRSRAELEDVIGCFVNTIPLRTTFRARESFVELLARVKNSDLDAFSHQDLPFEQLVESLQPERSLEHTPIFQVMLILQNAPTPVGNLAGLTMQPLPIGVQAPQFELTAAISEESDELAVSLEFAMKRFTPATIERLGRNFRQVLESVAQNPEQEISRIEFLDAADRELAVETCNRTTTPFPRGTLDGLFAEQARKTPQAVALVDRGGSELTYAELEAYSSRLAKRLVARGVRPERVVGVRMERSAETVICLLAILKAGGVYLPLDPAYPADRLKYIAADAGAMLVLDSINGLGGEADLPTLTNPDRLAYAIYTSGTTGRPKGVAVTHAALVNLAFARRECHDPLGVGDRVLAAVSVGFDVSLGQLLLPLLSGATVVIAGDLRIMGAREFWRLLSTRQVTHINSVPSFFDSILDSAPNPGTLPLKRLMLGGEALRGDLVARIRRVLPGVEVVNMYGPTEACIDATYHVATETDLAAGVLPIGKPLSNYRAYVLDGALSLVGIGIAGELYLGGAGLARGYVNAPDLTAERFVADPFSIEPGARLYHTGDRARQRADGSIDFLGRADQQVKIRGFRVEPEEVETQLRRQPGIREAAVIPKTAGNETRLIGYYAADGDVDAGRLRAGLEEVLPYYMVPSAFIRLDRLPISSNGKLDRKQLPDPGHGDLAVRTYEAPVGEAETKLAALWAELLKLERVGRHDNFFQLGGHSLLAVTLVERMKQLGLECDVRALFTAPTVAGLTAAAQQESAAGVVPPNLIPAGCAAITPEMLSLVNLTQGEIDRIVGSVPGGAANIQDIYRLAPLQEGILFQHRLTTNGDPYLAPLLLAFDNRERLDAFLLGLNQVTERHDVLRTSFAWKEMRAAAQVVWRKVTVPVEEVALNSPPGSASAAQQLWERFNLRAERLDLTRAPLLRIIVAEDTRCNRWLLLMISHHLILDHTSMEILVDELRILMRSADAQLPASLPYRNFIAATQASATSDQQQAFFSQMLSGVEEPTAPFGLTDIQSTGGQTIEQRLTVDGGLALRIREQARALGVTPASLFHTAWAAVLSHICGKSSVVFGTVLFGRMRSGAGADRVVGMFINTLPIRLDVDSTGAAESVRRTHRLLAELMLHEHSPLALAQRCSGVQAPAPLFSSLFNYRYGAGDAGETEWPGVEMLNGAERTSYPLAMAVNDSGLGFTMTALADPQAHPERVCQYLQQALSGLVDLLERAPQTPLETLQVLPRAERRRVLEEWNRTEAAFEAGTLDGLFGRQASHTPDATAVVGIDGEELTYRELDERSTRLARQLAANGVGVGTVVGVRMQRSSETIIALLAILKAGGVYLPLDPAYPRDRLDYMLADAGAGLVLESVVGLAGEADLPLLTDARRLAYIIYTSGTTGRPKGVAVPHAAPVNLAFARRACHDPISVGDRVLAGISVGFDVSIGQLLLPLLGGATVVIAPDLKTMGAAEFWAFLAQRRVSHINSVPSFFDSILDVAPMGGKLALKRVMLGGEALSGALAARIRETLPSVEVVNMYGPTEACIDATFHVAAAGDLAEPVLPIGRALSNYRTYILDQRLEPAGVGVAGELYLGGACLAAGYVNAAELTAERFMADPFSATPGARLYRTGDLARWRADGAIEFLGRVDEQVKIRGFRVEPAEVEAQLRRQEGVRDAAVIAKGSANGTRLIAYYTGGPSLEAEALRTGMAAVLPDYMVPAAFVKLEQLPLTANGKLDRKALPDPGQAALAARAFEAPLGEAEEKMAAIWADLLKLDRVGRHDNFFELGGHSLLAMTLVERMQQQGLACDVRTLFTTPTVAALAAATQLGTIMAAAPKNGIVPGCQTITPGMLPLAKLTQDEIDLVVASVPGGVANVQDIYPLAPLQEGILFQHLMTTAGDPYLAPFLLAFDDRTRLDLFLGALRQLVARHDVLRTAMAWRGLEQPAQVVLNHVDVQVEELQLTGPSVAVQLRDRFDPAHYRLDLANAPLMRTAIAHDAARDRWLLLLLTHHIILDHTSMAIVVDELRTLMANPRAALPASVPYRNLIAQALYGGSREEHQAFFTRMLGDVEEPTAPFGLLNIQAESAAITESAATLDDGLSNRIREQARVLGVTPASIFHMAWAAVLRATAGKSDVVFGTVLLGRMRGGIGADRVVGMSINTLPIRIALGQTGAAESVKHAQRLLAELMVHEHAPLALAQRCSAVPPPAPLFSSLLNYRYSPEVEGNAPWPGVEMLDASERTNYPVAAAVDDTGVRFKLSVLALPAAGPERVCRYFERAVESLASFLETAPDTPADRVSVLSSAERRLVVEEWNQTDASFEQGRIESLFSVQAQRTPNAVAVIGQDGYEVSYIELDAKSTALAKQLAANGVDLETVVGVRMERSTETIIALLAILKAGGVYLPLDPAYPPERLDYMAKDAGALLVLDSIDGLQGEADLPHLTDASRLAYIIYTSGTTGRPKGVAVPHTAPVNLAFARRECHDPIGLGDRVLAAISVGFDVSIGQLLLPLLSGATVMIAPDLKTMSAAEFWQFLVERRVSHINSVPSFLDSVLSAAPQPETLALKRIMLGGEALSGVLVARIQQAMPGVQVVNMYGPTEACIDATFHLATGTDLSAVILPIGRPLPNYRAYVLDDRREPAAVGVSGELYIGGAGLARGYVGAPELTMERFVADPFSPGAGARLYRTGDQARWRADGSLEFLGRIDQQVKIRGFRVEPAEIEAQLRKQAGVEEAAVIAQTGANGTHLIAYYTGEPAPEKDVLRAVLSAVLPDYMVPAAFVKLDRLPLTANGKLDRKSLPRDAVQTIKRVYEPPQGETEAAMQGIFESILNVHPIGRTDNFFEIGGDSLAAMRLLNSVDGRFKVSLPMRQLFVSATIETISRAILSDAQSLRTNLLIPLQPGGERRALFCIHPAGGHVFCYLPLSRALGPQQPLYGIQASGLEEGEPLSRTIEEAAAEYLRAVRTIQPEGPYHFLGMSSGGLIAYEMAQQVRAAGGGVRLLSLLDTSVPSSDMNGALTDEMLLQSMAVELGCSDLLSGAPPQTTLTELVEMGLRHGRLPTGFSVQQAVRISAVFRNTVRMFADYRPKRWDGSALFVRALRRGAEGEKLRDWSSYIAGLEAVDMDCGHEDLVSPAWSGRVADLLNPRLGD